MTTTVQNTVNATNFTAVIQSAIKGVLTTYMPGIGAVYKSVRTISNPRTVDQPQIPCVMVQPIQDDPKMLTTAKYHTFYGYKVYFILADNNPDQLMLKLTDAGNIIQKLFSNNALDDQGAQNTNRFKRYELQAGEVPVGFDSYGSFYGDAGFGDGPYDLPNTFWVDSEMTPVDYSVPLVLGRGSSSPYYFAVGDCALRMQTVTIK